MNHKCRISNTMMVFKESLYIDFHFKGQNLLEQQTINIYKVMILNI